MTPERQMKRPLAEVDPDVYRAIQQEVERQDAQI